MRPANIRRSVIGWDGVKALRSLMRGAANRSVSRDESWSPAVDWKRGNTGPAPAFFPPVSSRLGATSGATENTGLDCAPWAGLGRPPHNPLIQRLEEHT